MGVINSVVIVGNLVRDAEQKQFANGGSVLNFTIAQTKRKKQGEAWVDDAQFFDVKYFSKTGEVAKYLVKGKSVAVQGELDQERWESDGQKRSAIKVKAFELQLLGGQSTSGSDKPAYKPSESAQRAADMFGGSIVPPNHDSNFEDDIPF